MTTRQDSRAPTATKSVFLSSPGTTTPKANGVFNRAEHLIDILYEDNHCLAVSKPCGLSTQAPASNDSLEARVKDYLRERYQKKGRIYLGVPHRLDRVVSGVVLFARQTKSAQRLAQQFQERTVEKCYLAIVEGRIAPAEGEWEDWIRKIPDEARVDAFSTEREDARHALTRYRVLEQDEDCALVELLPQTGRMHQLRIQTASRGWSVLGDTLYGASPFFDAETIALHARSLSFDHPISYERMTIEAPVPATILDRFEMRRYRG